MFSTVEIVMQSQSGWCFETIFWMIWVLRTRLYLTFVIRNECGNMTSEVMWWCASILRYPLCEFNKKRNLMRDVIAENYFLYVFIHVKNSWQRKFWKTLCLFPSRKITRMKVNKFFWKKTLIRISTNLVI